MKPPSPADHLELPTVADPLQTSVVPSLLPSQLDSWCHKLFSPRVAQMVPSLPSTSVSPRLFTKPHSDGSVRDDVAQCQDFLREQTGFSSYAAYVKAACQRRPHLRPLLDKLDRWEKAPTTSDEIAARLPPDRRSKEFIILELSDGEGSSINLRARPSDEMERTGRDLLYALHHPRPKVRVQIIIWFWSSRGLPLKGLVDVFGLGLKLDPRFFETLVENLRNHGTEDSEKATNETRPTSEIRPLGYSHIAIGGEVATVARGYIPNMSNAVPVVLIASSLRQQTDADANIIYQELSEPPNFDIQHLSEQREVDPHGYIPFYQLYKALFAQIADQAGIGPSSDEELIFTAFIPLLRLNLLRIRETCRRTRLFYSRMQGWNPIDQSVYVPTATEQATSKLDGHRLSLRRCLEDSEDGIEHFRNYMVSRIDQKLLSNPQYLEIKNDTSQLHAEGHRLETEIHDFIQLQISRLAIQESKESIRVSNLQIEEGKRGELQWHMG